MKDLSAKLWYDVGSVEVSSAEELKSGSPFTPILSEALRAIMVETIRGCAGALVDPNPELSGVDDSWAVNRLNAIADKVAKTRFHLLYPDLKEPDNASR